MRPLSWTRDRLVMPIGQVDRRLVTVGPLVIGPVDNWSCFLARESATKAVTIIAIGQMKNINTAMMKMVISLSMIDSFDGPLDRWTNWSLAVALWSSVC